MSTPGELATTLGHQPEEIQWPTTSIPPVDPARFGKDHWSTFAYIETRIVDNKGAISHDHMRCHGGRHPIMLVSKVTGALYNLDASRYPSILAGGELLTDHDDYDCLDDLIAAGLLVVHMPRRDGRHFLDHTGAVILYPDGEPIDATFITGLVELRLAAYATFALTERGRQVASDLRAHLAIERNFSCFRMA